MQNFNGFSDEALIRKDSISSQKIGLSALDESLRIDNSFNLAKKITISRFLLQKLLTFFNNFITNLDTSQENKKTMFKLIDLVKTESDNFTVEQNTENEKLSEFKTLCDKITIENEILKKNQISLNKLNNELNEQVFSLILNQQG